MLSKEDVSGAKVSASDNTRTWFPRIAICRMPCFCIWRHHSCRLKSGCSVSKVGGSAKAGVHVEDSKSESSEENVEKSPNLSELDLETESISERE